MGERDPARGHRVPRLSTGNAHSSSRGSLRNRPRSDAIATRRQGEALGYPPSWWAASARDHCVFPELAQDLEADVAIIGGGFTGLSAAHHLHQAGQSCIVLEANQIGWGASGRNGGIAVPRYKLSYPELEAKYGVETAVLMYRIAHEALDTLEAIVHERDLQCDFSRTGHLTPVVSQVDVDRFSRDVEWLSDRVSDRCPSVLGRQQTASKLGTGFYAAAYLEPRGAALHPLEYCLSLANALSGKRVGIYCATPVGRWEATADGVVLHTPGGRVKARSLVLATNAYSNTSGATRALERRVVPVASAVIATEPLPDGVRRRLLPQGEPATDAKRLTNYYRVLRDGSFFFGGRGGATSQASHRIYERLRRDMIAIFPDLADVSVRHQWFGLVAVTLDSLPHIGMLQPNVHYAMGYNGRGVALAALLGKQLARRCMGAVDSLGPITEARFPAIPFHSLRVPAKQIAISWRQLLDSISR
jgi:gamma-glutamylputrescine oxidase